MFTSSLFEESKALQEDIAAVAEKVNDPALCEKVRLFVYGPKEIQAIYRADAGRPHFLNTSRGGLMDTYSGREHQLTNGNTSFKRSTTTQPCSDVPRDTGWKGPSRIHGVS